MREQDTPGVDWQAKHAAASTNAQPANDRPYNGWQNTSHTISDNDITTNPTNPIEDTQ